MLTRPHHFQLLEADSVSMTIDEVTALSAKNVGHLHGAGSLSLSWSEAGLCAES